MPENTHYAAFFAEFKRQDFARALQAFNQFSASEQQDILKQLYYQAREADTPVALSVLYRRLHPGKTFADFQQGWFPSKEHTQPFQVGDKTYHQFFPVPMRVINAVNQDDPSEIISVGMAWCTETEFDAGFQQSAQMKSNQQRRDNIADVADKISAKVYKVKADTNLGI